ncbi:MAG TPA: Gfo/Idh/MocA family oxidoreductase [Clostridia bacterium]|nr:MAG: Glucose--fructose oxidoreductase precursor [Firmicutes bacterium ADurb.Bin146]HOD93507.1 Gfo/Idh/MocA family oxidoreductase [Clostridia bacterium]HQM39807.1 Gfo/Idh/MocA family oxidoreductase [Clostridia bacterium]
MSNEVIRYGIIGCGGIAHTHAESLMQIKGAKLIGVSGCSAQEPLGFAQKYGIKSFDSTELLLKSQEIDAVTICTPSGFHAAIAINAAENKKHAIIEKPLSLTAKSAKQVVEAFKRNKVTGSVISQLRFSEEIRKAKKLIADKKLGDIIMTNLTMKYFRSQEYYDAGNWRGTWKLDGGGAMMNQGIHGIDMLLFLIGETKNVYGYIRTLTHNIEVEDNAVALVEFKNGSLGTITASTSIVPAKNKTIEVHGTKGTILIEEERIRYLHIKGEKEYIADDIEQGDSATSNIIKASGHIKQLEDFTQSLIEGKPPFVSLEDGMRAVNLITSVYASSKTNRIYNKKEE